MKIWQRILSQHHSVKIINETQVVIPQIVYTITTKTLTDDTITRIGNYFIDSDGHKFTSIYDYLGY